MGVKVFDGWCEAVNKSDKGFIGQRLVFERLEYLKEENRAGNL